jgi:hypothetical protein
MLRNIRKNTVKHCINCILGAACGPLWASSGSRLGVCGSPLGLCWASAGPLWASGGLRGETGELWGTSGVALGGYVGLSGSLLGFRWVSGGLKGSSGGRKTRVNYTETPETRKNIYKLHTWTSASPHETSNTHKNTQNVTLLLHVRICINHTRENT